MTCYQRHIIKLSNDILSIVVSEITESSMFALQLDEWTNVASGSQLLIFAWYTQDDGVKKEYFSASVYAPGEDVFETLNLYMPTMIGIRSGFQGIVKQLACQVYDLKKFQDL